MNRKFLEIDNIRLHFKSRGRGDTTFILLHGFGDFLHSWDEYFKPLSKIGRVVAYDRMGFGFSARKQLSVKERIKNNPYSKLAQAKRLCKLIKKLDCNEVILVGHSSGTTIALLAALRGNRSIKGLILISPSTYVEEKYNYGILNVFKRQPFYSFGLLSLKLMLIILGLLKGQVIDFATFNKDAISNEYFEKYKDILEEKDWDRSIWELTLVSESYGILGRLKDMKLPVQVIHGKNDRIIPLKYLQKFIDNIPQSKLVLLDNCGHLPMHEKMAEVLKLIIRFAKDLV